MELILRDGRGGSRFRVLHDGLIQIVQSRCVETVRNGVLQIVPSASVNVGL